jgi:hypothetical protein
MDKKQNEGLALSKYNIYTSKIRNVYNGSNLGMALIGLSQSNLIDNINSKRQILFVGTSLLIIAILYGIDNVLDYEDFVYKHGINDNVSVINNNSIYNDILIIKMLLALLIIVVLTIIINIFL